MNYMNIILFAGDKGNGTMVFRIIINDVMMCNLCTLIDEPLSDIGSNSNLNSCCFNLLYRECQPFFTMA